MEHDILTFVNYDALAARNEGCFDVPWVQFLNDCLIYIYIYPFGKWRSATFLPFWVPSQRLLDAQI